MGIHAAHTAERSAPPSSSMTWNVFTQEYPDISWLFQKNNSPAIVHSAKKEDPWVRPLYDLALDNPEAAQWLVQHITDFTLVTALTNAEWITHFPTLYQNKDHQAIIDTAHALPKNACDLLQPLYDVDEH